MKPHLAHIQHTMKRKQLANEAGNVQVSYKRYRHMVDECLKNGTSKERIVDELKAEYDRILEDAREGDQIFQQGLANSKSSCMNAIDMILAELQGD